MMKKVVFKTNIYFSLLVSLHWKNSTKRIRLRRHTHILKLYEGVLQGFTCLLIPYDLTTET